MITEPQLLKTKEAFIVSAGHATIDREIIQQYNFPIYITPFKDIGQGRPILHVGG